MAYSIYAFLLLVLIANISSNAWLAGLDCERHVTRTTLQQGDATTITVIVHNKRGWPIPWLFVEDLHPAHCFKEGESTRLTVLMPGRTLRYSYKLTFSRRGYHRVGPLMMESGDLFGLQRKFRTGQQQDYVSVLPTIAYIDTFNVASKRPQGPVRITSRAYEDPTLLSGMRPYVPGDPLNRIHWKASARTGDLYVKQFEPSTVQGGTVLLDLHAESYKPERTEFRMELAITTAASISFLLQSSGEQVGMMTNGLDAAEVARYEIEAQRTLSREELEERVAGEGMTERIAPLHVPTMRSPIQARKIAENLARVVPGHGLDMQDMLMAEFRGLPRDAALLIIVPQVTESLAMALGEMKLSGFAVTVFFIADNQGYEEAAPLLAAQNIHVFHIENERSLHEIAPQKIGQ